LTSDETQSQLHAAFRRLVQAMLHPFWQRVRAAGLTMPQVFAMRYIQRHANATVSDVARALGVSNAAVSQMLQRLVVQGYILREEAPHDRRSKHLRLTAKGETVLQKIMPSSGGTFGALLSRLTPEEAQQVLTALEILLAKLPTDENETHASPGAH